MKWFALLVMTIGMLGLTACDDSGSSNSNSRYDRYRYRGYSDDVYVTSPRGSNCIYRDGRYIESYRDGYSRRSRYSYRDRFDPFSSRFGDRYNLHYRNPLYSRYGCDDLDLFLDLPGYYPYPGDYRTLGLDRCGFDRRPVGIGWGVLCVDVSVHSRFGLRDYRIRGRRGVGSSRGQECNPLTDTFCSCRAITYGGRNPGQFGICTD